MIQITVVHFKPEKETITRMFQKVLLLCIVLTWMTDDVHGCSCFGFQHPQSQFCSANYVFYGKVIKETLIPGPPDDTANNFAIWKYTFSIIFKMKGVTEGFGQEVVVETRGNGALCGVRFTVGKSYILMGRTDSDGKKSIGLCNFIRQLSSLSPYQTFYMFTRGVNSYNLNCRRRCNKIDQDSRGCKYEAGKNDKLTICLARNALCKRERRRCRWVNNETC
ncbi:metalloproteinase inhibitor 3 [Mytilus galloprovincialis]|uniref:Metalloproteinase inhibitor 3 n=1 Tax=Mytilus galloprovincialis TaxID=29158 RepID=A0A8B6F3Y6_MYTGA|nr:metalloproteinase inhibitor 3 [Mytilus galloprovincialis]